MKKERRSEQFILAPALKFDAQLVIFLFLPKMLLPVEYATGEYQLAFSRQGHHRSRSWREFE